MDSKSIIFVLDAGGTGFKFSAVQDYKEIIEAFTIKTASDTLEEQLQKIWVLRKVISPMDDVEIIELLLDRMSKSKDNEAFLRSMNTSDMG